VLFHSSGNAPIYSLQITDCTLDITKKGYYEGE
jgi:hypothetical protein